MVKRVKKTKNYWKSASVLSILLLFGVMYFTVGFGPLDPSVQFAKAAAVTWDGDTDLDWCTPANWSGDTLPTDADDVTIDTAATIITSGCGAGEVDFSTLTIGENNAATLDLGDVLGTAGTITIKGNGTIEQNTSSTLSFTGDLTMESGATLTHADNSTSHAYSVNMSFGGDIDIQSGATVDVDTLGYDGGDCNDVQCDGYGPGGGEGAGGQFPNGGSHGGKSGQGSAGLTVDNPYCDITGITTIGSGGGNPSGGIGGSGGGLVRLVSSGILTVEGTITADGDAGTANSAGGAGGGIWLYGVTVTGTPTGIGANGGARGSANAGGGGGGCIAVEGTTVNIIDHDSTVTANGGASYTTAGLGALSFISNGIQSEEWDGESSSDWFTAVNWSSNIVPTTTDDVIIDDETIAITSGETVTFRNLTIGKGINATNLQFAGSFNSSATQVTVASSSFFTQTTSSTITLGGDLIVESGGTLTHSSNGTSHQYSVNLDVDNFTLNSGGTIDGASKGYAGVSVAGNGNGPGAGLGAPSDYPGGGAHGGNGGDGLDLGGGTAYCVASTVDTIGSSGGSPGGGTTGSGGGLIRLTVSSTATFNGAITVAGGNGNSNNGGGAGGGFYVNATTVTGTPSSFDASGGNRGSTNAGGGGGGCIYIGYTSANSITSDEADLTAGASYSAAGAGSFTTEQILTGPVWTGDGGDNDWCTADNWAQDSVPTDSQDVVIDAAVTVTTSGCSADEVDFSTLTLGENNASILDMGNVLGTAGSMTIKGNGTLEQNTSSTLTFTGTITVESGGEITHADNSTAHLYSVNISAANIDIQTGGSIDVDQNGYDKEEGPAPGDEPTSIGSGGGHGGTGGAVSNAAGGVGNCTISSPSIIGSGGGGSKGGSGGGFVKLNASGTITVDGTITADGQASTGDHNGGGAAGGVYLVADIFAGSPDSFTVIGGDGASTGYSFSGGGGGGCVNITYTTSNTLGDANINVSGGNGGYQDGGGGMLLIQDSDASGEPTLIVESAYSSNADTPQADTTVTYDSITLTGGSVYNVPSGRTLTLNSSTPFQGASGSEFEIEGTLNATTSTAVTGGALSIEGGTFNNSASFTDIESNGGFYVNGSGTVSTTISTLTSSGTLRFYSGGTVPINNLELTGGTMIMYDFVTTSDPFTINNDFTITSGVLQHSANSTAQSHIIKIAADNLTIASGGSIDVDDDGYRYDEGPGAGDNNSNRGSGGAHGGDGGNSSDRSGGTAYCNIADVDTMGSGGGGGVGDAGDGGGLIILNVTSTLTINGTITADGQDALADHDGGGAGGGINITAATVAGSPVSVSATGGTGRNSGSSFSGGGGGGCILVTYTNSTVLDEIGDVSLAGGAGGAENGDIGLFSAVSTNNAPTATMGGIPSQTNATYVTATTTVADSDSNVTSLIVEYSTDGTTWTSSTLGVITETEGGDGVTTSTGNIADIDTDNDGSVTITSIQWNIEADLPNTDDSTVYLRFIPYDGIGYGNIASSTAFAIDTADPAVPGNLAVGTLASSTINFTFPSASSDTNFSEYKIFYDTNSSVNEADTAFTSSSDANLGAVNFNAAGTSENITGLTPNTTYYFNLFAYDTWGAVTSSASELSTTTLANVPEGVTFASYATSSITVIWSSSDNNPAGTVYEVYNVTDGASVGTTTNDNLPVTGLTPGTQYAFKVRAQNSDGAYTAYTSNSDMVTFPVAGSTPTTSNVSTASLDLTFTAGVNGATTTFALYNVTDSTYISAAGAPTASAVYQSTSTWGGTVSLTGLTPGESYTFQSIAYATDNTATSTASAAVYTLAAAPVTVTAAAVDQTTATVTWTDSNSSSTQYAILETNNSQYVNSSTLALGESSPEWAVTSTWFTTADPLTVTGLTAATEYCFAVAARNADNTETSTTTATCVTTAAVPVVEEESSSGGVPIPQAPLILDIMEGKDVAFEINSGDVETNSEAVTLSINATNVSHMAISNSLDFTGVSFVPFNSSYSHILNAGNGIKTVYARLRSAQGGTLTVSDTISLIGQLFEAEKDSTTTEPVDCTLTTDKAYSVPGEAGIYYVTTQCTKRPFRRSDTYFTYFTSWEAVIDTTQNTLDNIPDDSLGFMPLGPLYNPASGALIKLPNDPKVYLLLGETIYHIANEEAAEFQFGPQWNTWIDTVDPRVEQSYIMSSIVLGAETRPDGILIKYLDNNKVYQLETTSDLQEKRWITDEETFISLRFRWDRIVTIPSSEGYEDGQDL